jgi:hypothetical protein
MPIRLNDDAIERLVARDERLRHPDGKPNHSEILRISGVSSTQWWKVRRGDQDPGAKTIPRLVGLAKSTGLTEGEAYSLLFTDDPRTQEATAA